MPRYMNSLLLSALVSSLCQVDSHNGHRHGDNHYTQPDGDCFRSQAQHRVYFVLYPVQQYRVPWSCGVAKN